MNTNFSKYVPLLLFVPATVATAACGEAKAISPTSPATVQSASITAESETVTAEFVPGLTCRDLPPFRTRVVIVVRGGQDVIVQRLQFAFTDRLGGTIVPITIAALPTSASSVTSPTSTSVATPGSISISSSSPVPVPGSSAIQGMLISANTSRPLPFQLDFACGVPAAGTLVVSVDTMDMTGARSTSQVSVRIVS